MNFIKLIKGKTLIYLLSKYLTLLLKVFRTFFLAIVLGPYYYGIWGFILLIQQYLQYSDLGIKHSLNVILSVGDKNNITVQRDIVSSAILIDLVVAVVVISASISIKLFDISIFEKYTFNNYIILVGIISALMIINQMFINLYRSYGKLPQIAFYELSVQIIIIPFIFIFKESKLLTVLLWAIVCVEFFNCVLFFIFSPVKLILKIDWESIHKLLIKGIQLVFYNMSFYFIIISSKTIISKYFEVEDMGQFSFLTNVTTAAFMGLQAISWMIFPKALNRLNINTSNIKAANTIRFLRALYLPAMHGLIFIIIGMTPILIILLPAYQKGISLLSIVILAQGILLSGYGYGIINIARNKELQLTFYGFAVVILNVLLSMLSIHFISFEIEYVVLSLFISVIIYPILQVKLANRTMNIFCNYLDVFRIIFPIKTVLPMLLSLTIFFVKVDAIYYILVPVVFILLNYNKMLYAFIEGKKIFTNPSIIDL